MTGCKPMPFQDVNSDTIQSIIQTKKKPIYPVGEGLRRYLEEHGRLIDFGITYDRLRNYFETCPIIDNEGNDTLWETVIYAPEEMRLLSHDLTKLYIILKTEGDFSLMDNLFIDRIDYCTFGNSNPFRIRVVNAINDNQDYYYIKQADASRIYGLELEHLLSPNRMHYLVCGQTLVEEHIVGIPGDVFIRDWLKSKRLKPIRVAKELVKFNERCFVRLLGDMRSYNFVVDVTPDFEEAQIRIRAMDFDQQSYSGRMNFYRPQFFKENNDLVFYCMEHLNQQTAYQYQREELALIHRRIQLVGTRLHMLLRFMCEDQVSPQNKVLELREALAEHYDNPRFLKCHCMGQIVYESLQTLSRAMNKFGSKQPYQFVT